MDVEIKEVAVAAYAACDTGRLAPIFGALEFARDRFGDNGPDELADDLGRDTRKRASRRARPALERWRPYPQEVQQNPAANLPRRFMQLTRRWRGMKSVSRDLRCRSPPERRSAVYYVANRERVFQFSAAMLAISTQAARSVHLISPPRTRRLSGEEQMPATGSGSVSRFRSLGVLAVSQSLERAARLARTLPDVRRFAPRVLPCSLGRLRHGRSARKAHLRRHVDRAAQAADHLLSGRRFDSQRMPNR